MAEQAWSYGSRTSPLRYRERSWNGSCAYRHRLEAGMYASAYTSCRPYVSRSTKPFPDHEEDPAGGSPRPVSGPLLSGCSALGGATAVCTPSEPNRLLAFAARPDPPGRRAVSSPASISASRAADVASVVATRDPRGLSLCGEQMCARRSAIVPAERKTPRRQAASGRLATRDERLRGRCRATAFGWYVLSDTLIPAGDRTRNASNDRPRRNRYASGGRKWAWPRVNG